MFLDNQLIKCNSSLELHTMEEPQTESIVDSHLRSKTWMKVIITTKGYRVFWICPQHMALWLKRAIALGREVIGKNAR